MKMHFILYYILSPDNKAAEEKKQILSTLYNVLITVKKFLKTNSGESLSTFE